MQKGKQPHRQSTFSEPLVAPDPVRIVLAGLLNFLYDNGIPRIFTEPDVYAVPSLWPLTAFPRGDSILISPFRELPLILVQGGILLPRHHPQNKVSPCHSCRLHPTRTCPIPPWRFLSYSPDNGSGSHSGFILLCRIIFKIFAEISLGPGLLHGPR